MHASYFTRATNLGLIGAILVVAGWVDCAQAQPSPMPDPRFWIADGPVLAMVETNGTLYMGGSFSAVGPNTEAAALIGLTDGQAELTFPRVDGIVYAVAPDGGGGWYLGGRFTSVGGVARTNLAHILADRTVDVRWDSAPNASRS